ncbi:MAG: hypothetical protein DHS20C18_15390 [Saprospiraceae bacterium]|nr:MAG: hypothetical protein DHS20C18_15390 [Saprospiraceae bacterium]
MDKLDYNYSQSNDDYVVYHVNVSAGEKVILEVGRESKKAESNLPTPFIGCFNGTFDLRLVDRVNKRIDEVFMVYPRGNKYYISPITFAGYYKFNDQEITYLSPKYKFQFDRKHGAIGEDISYNNKKSKVYFEGQLENECNGTLLFRQFSSTSSMAHIDLMLVPEIGVIEERSGANLEAAQNNTLKLNDVNGKSYERYLRAICGKANPSGESLAAVRENIPQESDVTPVYPTPNQPNLVVKDGSARPTNYDEQPPVAKASFHSVKKGETLYAISRKYDVTVSQIKEWNNKGNNTIRVGESLRVNAGADNTTTAQANLTSKGAIQTTSTAISRPQPSNISIATTNEYHTVRSGETVPSIALKYGYTEARFREINNLSKNEFIKIGQQLKVSDCNCPAATAKPFNSGASVYNPISPAFHEDLTPRTVEPMPYSQPSSRIGYDNTIATPSAYSNTQSRIYTSAQPENTTSKGGIQYYDTPVPQPSAPSNANYYQSANTSYPATNVNSGYPTTNNLPDFDEPVRPQSFETINTSFKSPNAANGKRTQHQVQEGETLYSIARKYGVSVEYLRSINNLERNEVIIPYQRVFIN